MISDPNSLDRISRSDLEAKLRDRWKAAARRYRKTGQVHARPARDGERVVSTTWDGVETENVASEGDFVVENQTEARERYLVGADKFGERYDFVAALEDDWAVYKPSEAAQVLALRADDALLKLLGKESSFWIEAPWGEAQRVNPGDVLVAPPDLSEIYRIAQREFAETYSPV